MAPQVMSEKEKCVSIWHNLLRHTDREGMLSTAYVREFMETKRCDQYADLSDCRRNLEVRLVPGGRLARIVAYSETDVDERVAAQAVLHYEWWHEKRLLQCLPTSSWVRL